MRLYGAYHSAYIHTLHLAIQVTDATIGLMARPVFRRIKERIAALFATQDAIDESNMSLLPLKSVGYKLRDIQIEIPKIGFW